ncbi:hypothetical protein BC829DRAFT_420595 [Chytridium lagenaria]|nr:hypothetical protein BC829DRAFT_420595 [Chytridium lagenaria]
MDEHNSDGENDMEDHDSDIPTSDDDGEHDTGNLHGPTLAVNAEDSSNDIYNDNSGPLTLDGPGNADNAGTVPHTYIEGAYNIRRGRLVQETSIKQKAIRKNAFQRNSQNTSSKAKNSFFKRKWESILQNADLLSREMNGGIMVFATYPECTSAKAYMSPAFKENVPGFKISELKRLNDCYLVSANGDTQMHLAAGRDTLVTLMHENNATRRNIISNFDQMHKAQAGMAEKMEVIVQCLEDKVEALEERVLLQLKEIEDKLQLLPAPEHRISVQGRPRLFLLQSETVTDCERSNRSRDSGRFREY